MPPADNVPSDADDGDRRWVWIRWSSPADGGAAADDGHVPDGALAADGRLPADGAAASDGGLAADDGTEANGGLAADDGRPLGLGLYTRVLGHENAASGADPIVLLHGLGVSGEYWMPTARLLARHFRIIVPDLPGFGRSDKPPRALDIGELAEAIASWMDVMEIDRAVLIGNSMGCQVAVRLAIAQPDRVSRLILQGMTIDPDARSAGKQMARLLADGFVEPPSLLPVVVRDYLRVGFRGLWDTLQHSLDDPIEQNLTRLDVPTLVVRGERDPIVPQRWAETSARLVPDGHLVVIPAAAHALNFGRPAAFTRVIREFISSGKNGTPELDSRG